MRYSRVRIDGTCSDCGAPSGGRCRCERCHKTNAKRLVERRKWADANGICSYCFVDPREEGIKKCRPCADYCNMARASQKQAQRYCPEGHKIGGRSKGCVKCRGGHGK